MEDKDGNRFTIPSRSVETQRPLKMINPNYHYYMGGTWLHTFDPYKRPITEIISNGETIHYAISKKALTHFHI